MYLRERSPFRTRGVARDFIQLAGRMETHREGDLYSQSAHERHDGDRNDHSSVFRDIHGLSVCRPEGTPFLSDEARPASPAEVEGVTTQAFAWL
jgi:hypothetical protein